MSKPIPLISKYMTTTPQAIQGSESILSASKKMSELGIRHLPVLDGDRLLGVLSDRDLRFVQGFPDVDPKQLTADAVMTEEPYSVSPDQPLDEVAATMAEQKYGSAIVVQNGRVVGIFTTVDACRALAELLSSRLKRS